MKIFINKLQSVSVAMLFVCALLLMPVGQVSAASLAHISDTLQGIQLSLATFFDSVPEPMVQGETVSSAEILGTATSITDRSVTYHFAEPVQYGTYMTGGYWVIGPVTITQITPDAGSGRNGLQVNVSTQDQALDDRIHGYAASVHQQLPYDAAVGDSLLKAVSLNPNETTCRPCLESASILTIVDAPPAVDAFRPPYAGFDRTEYRYSDLDLSLLPAVTSDDADGNAITLPKYKKDDERAADYDVVGDSLPSLDWVTDTFAFPWIDYRSDWTGRSMHPKTHMPNYGGEIANHTGTAVLRLMLDDTLEAKRPALQQIIQYAIDIEGMMLGAGTRFPGNGGHGNGRKLPLALAAVLFDDSEMKTLVSDTVRKVWSENDHTYFSQTANNGEGMILLGSPTNEATYWRLLETNNGFRTGADPYGYIDGGPRAGDLYLIPINSALWKAPVLAMELMPELTPVWNDEKLKTFVERYVNHGKWTQPDPCAPFDGNPDNRGVTYGPDGNGDCIKDTDSSDGIGRFPERHGTCTDACAYSFYRVPLADALWPHYYDNVIATTEYETDVEDTTDTCTIDCVEENQNTTEADSVANDESDPNVVEEEDERDISTVDEVEESTNEEPKDENPDPKIEEKDQDQPSENELNSKQNQIFTTANLNVRTAPNGNIVTLMPLGSVATVLNKDEPNRNGHYWLHVRFENGTQGYVAKTYTQSKQSSTAAVRVQTTDNLNVRSAPGGLRLHQVPAGAAGVRVSSTLIEQGGYKWLQVRFDNGVEGYVASGFLTTEQVRSPQPDSDGGLQSNNNDVAAIIQMLVKQLQALQAQLKELQRNNP